MQQQLNTPEELRAIRQAMDEGKNPLVVTVCHDGKTGWHQPHCKPAECLNLRCFPHRRKCWAICRSAIRLRKSSPILEMRFAPAYMVRMIDCW